MYYSQKNIKTADAREWTAQILFALNDSKVEKALEDLRENFDPMRHSYKFDFTFYYPRHLFFTKKGDVSSKTLDQTNVEKPLQDILCSSQYFRRPCPEGAANLNINDRYVTDVISRKRPSEAHSIEIEIEILDLKFIEQQDLQDAQNPSDREPSLCPCTSELCTLHNTEKCPLP